MESRFGYLHSIQQLSHPWRSHHNNYSRTRSTLTPYGNHTMYHGFAVKKKDPHKKKQNNIISDLDLLIHALWSPQTLSIQHTTHNDEIPKSRNPEIPKSAATKSCHSHLFPIMLRPDCCFHDSIIIPQAPLGDTCCDLPSPIPHPPPPFYCVIHHDGRCSCVLCEGWGCRCDSVWYTCEIWLSENQKMRR